MIQFLKHVFRFRRKKSYAELQLTWCVKKAVEYKTNYVFFGNPISRSKLDFNSLAAYTDTYIPICYCIDGNIIEETCPPLGLLVEMIGLINSVRCSEVIFKENEYLHNKHLKLKVFDHRIFVLDLSEPEEIDPCWHMAHERIGWEDENGSM